MTTQTTLTTEIADCILEARKQGWTGFDRDYALTREDCESIITALGRKPSFEEWADAGYPGIGGAHVADRAVTYTVQARDTEHRQAWMDTPSITSYTPLGQDTILTVAGEIDRCTFEVVTSDPAGLERALDADSDVITYDEM